MKNLKSFPFERNRYFYGKLLSVDDFETEQRYFNNKRRTINRFLFGSGVVCGLNVVEVDEESISVERGLALDFAGREIMIDEPVVKRIAELEGYDDGQSQDSGFYYLCLEYGEEAAELVHNVAGTAEKNEGEYNKYREGYRLFVTQMEPERNIFSAEQFYEEKKEIYSGEGIRVSQVLPRYLETGADTVLRVEIENTGQQQNISFDYDLTLSFLTCREETSVHVHFDEKEHTKDKKYTMELPLKVARIKDVDAKVSVAAESFVLHTGEREYRISKPCSSQASVSSRDSYERLQEMYYKSAMDYIVNNTFQQSIYLAKIYVVKSAETCMIDWIEPLPFGQRILHTEISSALVRKLTDDVKRLKAAGEAVEEVKKNTERRREKPLRAAYGDVVFDLESADQGDVLYSDRIVHGLGFGPAAIVLGYEKEAEGASEEESTMVFGDLSVFQSPKDGLELSLGAKLEPSEGSFIIGMKIRKRGGAKKVKVYWTALRDQAQKPKLQKKKRIYIQPDIPNLYTGESLVFTVILEGFQDERLKWTVKDMDGGTIDKNGKYTAPDIPGVFQINVASMAYPKVRATTFVVVQEKRED